MTPYAEQPIHDSSQEAAAGCTGRNGIHHECRNLRSRSPQCDSDALLHRTGCPVKRAALSLCHFNASWNA